MFPTQNSLGIQFFEPWRELELETMMEHLRKGRAPVLSTGVHFSRAPCLLPVTNCDMWPLCLDGCLETLPDTADPPSSVASERSSAHASHMHSKYRHSCAVAERVPVVWGQGGTFIMSLTLSPRLFCPPRTLPASHARSAASQTSSLKLTLNFNLPVHRAPHPNVKSGNHGLKPL